MTTAIICDEYISREPGVKLVRTPNTGWRSAVLNGEVIDDLDVEEVTTWLKEDGTFEEVALCPDCRQPLGADVFCLDCSIPWDGRPVDKFEPLTEAETYGLELPL